MGGLPFDPYFLSISMRLSEVAGPSQALITQRLLEDADNLRKGIIKLSPFLYHRTVTHHTVRL
jgi:hypothetical protein